MNSAHVKKRLLAGDDERAAIVEEIAKPVAVLLPRDAGILAGLAVALGLLADLLFRDAGLGINLPIWLAMVVAGLRLVGRRLGLLTDPGRIRLLMAAVGFSALAAWRDSDSLAVLDIGSTGVLILVAVGMPAEVGLRRLGPVALALAASAAAASLLSSAWRLVSRIPWNRLMAPQWRREAPVLGRALLVATPLLVTFGGLFFAADAVFAAQLKQVFSLDLGGLPSHCLWVVGGSWLAGAMLWSGLAVAPPNDIEVELPERHRLRVIETAIVLVPLVVLFALFVLVQVRYFFGGEEMVQRSIHLTYAQYARRGFFELVVASFLLLPVLFAINWARRRERVSNWLFACLSLALVALLFVVMASAWQRLGIYVDTFGLTELRFYSAAVLPWLTVAFVWFMVSVVRQQRETFFPGAALAALAAVMVLNVISPDAVIAGTNTKRLDAGRSFDGAYAASLSADAVPTLVRKLDAVPPADRCTTAALLVERWSSKRDDLRSWNYSRHKAVRVVQHNRERLEAACNSSP